MHNRPVNFFGILLLWILLAGCSLASAGNETLDPRDVPRTAVAQTVAAELTRVMRSTPTPGVPAQPSATPSATPTPAAQPTATETPRPSPTLAPCNRAQFLQDVRVQDGTIFTPGDTFVKTWRLQNTGICTWTPAYALVLVEGDRLGARTVVPLPTYVFPGETIDISVNLTAPATEGSYRGYWQLRSNEGILFGVGETAQRSFWVDIAVKEPLRQRIYNFATNACEAEWQSGAGDLSCEGNEKDPAGFVIFLDEVRLENRREDEPTLWVHPDFTDEGWIAGTYPDFLVQEGDRFEAWVGCLAASLDCQLEFRLGYKSRPNDPVQYLEEWLENYDEAVTEIKLDLSDLAGERVQFVLYTRVRQNPADANGFWFVPIIRRIEYFD